MSEVVRSAKLSDIKVGARHRQDLGDIASLAKSIRDVGLLHPLVVRQDMTLVAGRRRLDAIRELGWAEVPVNVVDGLDDALLALRAERDENTCRKDFTPSEAVAIGEALEKLERPKAQARQQAALVQNRKGQEARSSESDERAPAENGRTDEKVAEAVGMGRDKYRKAKAVVEAARQDPEELGPVAEEMNRTGMVEPAYQEVQRRAGKPQRSRNKAIVSGPGVLPADVAGAGSKNGKGKSSGRTHKEEREYRRLKAVTGAVHGLVLLVQADSLDEREARDLAGLDKHEQRRLAKAGPGAAKAKVADLRWLLLAPSARHFALGIPGSPPFDPSAEVSEDARREALGRLSEAMEELQKSRDTIAAWIAALKEKLGEQTPGNGQPGSAAD
jgi:ParB-like chromosome segregation protein Spo0J